MNINTLDKVFALFLFLLGIYITTTAVGYGYFQDNTPGPGFFPMWVGLLIAGLSIINFVRSLLRLEQLENDLDGLGMKKSAMIAAVLFAFVLLSEQIGMVVGCLALILIVAKILEPRWSRLFVLKIIATAVLFPLLAYVVFAVYLNVPVPLGTWFS